MASSAVTELGINLSDNGIEVSVGKPLACVWTLDCDIIVEDMDAVVQETKINDIVLAGSVLTEQLSVEIEPAKDTTLELDVTLSVNGVSSSVSESQVVPYERILQIDDFSPEATNEKRYASSAFASKRLYKLLSELESKVDNLELNGGGGGGGNPDIDLSKYAKITYVDSADNAIKLRLVSLESMWAFDNLGNLTTKYNLVVDGDIASAQDAGDPAIVGISGIRLNGTTYYDTDADGIIDLGTIQSGGGLTSVSWADIKDRPTTLSRFTNDMGFVTDASLGGIYDMVNDINDDIASLQTNKQDASTAINTGNIRNHAPSLTGEGATGNWNVRSAALYAPYKNSTTISEVAETLRYHATIPSSFASWCTGYNNAVLNISRHTDTGYSSQLGFSGGGMYYRHQNKGTWGEWKTVAFTDSTVANATKLDGKSLLVGTWNGIPTVAGGVMEIGRYIDFHHAADTGKDYTTRITAPVVDTPNNVTLPSTGGTLALLTSNVASATKLNTARKIWGQSFDGTKDINGDAVIDGNLVVKGDIASA
ncbi:MAG: hypothetical protein IKW20_00035 [Bacteroidales bacterium]|nr:hypothetical protein [Bacteroidales bacterium]